MGKVSQGPAWFRLTSVNGKVLSLAKAYNNGLGNAFLPRCFKNNETI